MAQLTRKRMENPPEFSFPADAGQPAGWTAGFAFTVFFCAL